MDIYEIPGRSTFRHPVQLTCRNGVVDARNRVSGVLTGPLPPLDFLCSQPQGASLPPFFFSLLTPCSVSSFRNLGVPLTKLLLSLPTCLREL